MDLLAILLLVIAIALVGTSWPRVPIRAFGASRPSLQDVMSVLLTVIAVLVCGYVLFFKASATPFQTQTASGLLGTCFGYWFKR